MVMAQLGTTLTYTSEQRQTMLRQIFSRLRDVHGATRSILIYISSSLALALAAWNVQHTPDTTTLTHQVDSGAANPSSTTSNPFASMLGCAMPQHIW